jgi:hypothetical protein
MIDIEREFMEDCYRRGWRYSGHPEGLFPSVMGTHEWSKALARQEEE